MITLDRAIQIAVQAHAGQTRKDGTPYILHPIRVMLRQTDPKAMIVAVLHDVVEDTGVTFEDLEREGCPGDVLSALRLLTHADGADYQAYIRTVAPDPLARAVKLGDLEDNMNLREFPNLTERDLARTAKYHAAWKVLSGVKDKGAVA